MFQGRASFFSTRNESLKCDIHLFDEFALINESLGVESPYQASGSRQAFRTQRSSEIRSLSENNLHDIFFLLFFLHLEVVSIPHTSLLSFLTNTSHIWVVCQWNYLFYCRDNVNLSYNWSIFHLQNFFFKLLWNEIYTYGFFLTF